MYLAYFVTSTKAKNGLEEDFEKYLKSIDRTLIENEELDSFIKDTLEEYDKLHKKHNRCKYRRPEWYKGGYAKANNKVILHSCNVDFYLLKSK